MQDNTCIEVSLAGYLRSIT